MTSHSEPVDFAIDRGGPLDGDECAADTAVCVFPVGAYPGFERDSERGEELLTLPDHPDGLVHLYARCWTCRAFHYLGIFRPEGRGETRTPLYHRV